MDDLPEIKGNTTNPSGYLRIQYCGGDGYMKHCIATMDHFESVMPGKLQYQLVMDKTITGNFEVTYHTDAACSGEGEMIHSKKASGAFPWEAADWDTFTLK